MSGTPLLGALCLPSAGRDVAQGSLARYRVEAAQYIDYRACVEALEAGTAILLRLLSDELVGLLSHQFVTDYAITRCYPVINSSAYQVMHLKAFFSNANHAPCRPGASPRIRAGGNSSSAVSLRSSFPLRPQAWLVLVEKLPPAPGRDGGEGWGSGWSSGWG